MSKSNAWETGLLLLLFNNTNFATVGDATGLRGSTVAGSLYVSGHTADPGEAGDQSTSEMTYGGYARVGIPRSGAGWVVTGNSVSPAANIDFPVGTSGGGTMSFMGIGTASSGAGVLLYSGTVTPNIVCGAAIIPRLSTATAVTED